MRLEFEGKHHIYGHHLTVPISPLIPDYEESVADADGEADDENFIIHGDNLYALKSLLPKYAGRVKCIYIDPPYNTGNEGWAYNDRVNSPTHRAWFQKEVGRDDLERHDKWCCMMWPRMHLLRELLRDDGVIFVSIDDNEVHHLKTLMDGIFGEENFVAQFAWQARESVQNDTDISVSHEYVLAYARIRRKSDRRLKESNAVRWHQIKEFAFNPLPASLSRYSNPDNDPRGPWKLDPFDAPAVRENLTYEIVNESTGQVHLPPPGRHWRTEYESFLELADEGRIAFGKSGNARPALKVFYEEKKDFGETSISWLTGNKYGTATSATKDLQNIFDGRSPLETVKPTELLKHLISISTRENDIVVDSFAGSGTTAHAVLALNREDGGNRRFILVECEDYADSTTAERVRRVIRGVPNAKDKALKEGLGGSFTYCALGDPLDVSKMLSGESLPSYRDMAVFMYHTATGQAIDPASVDISGDKPFCQGRERDFWLFYKPDIEWLMSSDSTFSEKLAERVARSSSNAVVFASHKYMPQRHLSEMGITFCQMPFADPV